MDHRNVSLGKVVKDIVRREGWRGLFRGFWLNTAGSFPGQFVYYVGYEYANSFYAPYFRRHCPQMEIASHALAGVTAEALSAISYLPTDIVSQRLQTHVAYSFLPERYQTGSAWKIVKHVWRTEGWRGFFRGYLPYLAVYGPGSAVWWAVYEASKRTLHKIIPDPLYDKPDFTGAKAINFMVSGSVAGVVSCLITNPLDVARTRLQLLEYGNGRERRALKGGFGQLLKETYQKEGIAGLYKGVKPRLWVRAPGSAIALVGYEYLKSRSVLSSSGEGGDEPGSDFQLHLL